MTVSKLSSTHGDYIIANCSSPCGTNKLCTAPKTCNNLITDWFI